MSDKIKNTIDDHFTKLVEECRTLIFHNPNYMPDVQGYTHSLFEDFKSEHEELILDIKYLKHKIKEQRETIRIFENKLWELENQ